MFEQVTPRMEREYDSTYLQTEKRFFGMWKLPWDKALEPLPEAAGEE